MADVNDNLMSGGGAGTTGTGTGSPKTTISTGTATTADWSGEDTHWRSSYASRPYVKADRGYEHYQGGYRYGFESAHRHRDRDWSAAESDLRSGWDSYEHRGSGSSTWDDVKDAVRDAWDRVRGHGDSRHGDHR